MLRFDRGKVLVWYMGTEGKMHIINKECIGPKVQRRCRPTNHWSKLKSRFDRCYFAILLIRHP